MKPNPKNPRKITDKKLEMLKKSLDEFGDLGGIVVNRKSGMIVSGHQRCRVLFGGDGSIPPERAHFDHEYDEPTEVGTVAEGYVTNEFGERYRYREVAWDELTEKAAVLAANKLAGEFDQDGVAQFLNDLEVGGFDMDLTMFDEDERDAAFMDHPATTALTVVNEPDPDGLPKHGKPIQLTPEQRDVFLRACEILKTGAGEDYSEGRCVELMAAEYMAGA